MSVQRDNLLADYACLAEGAAVAVLAVRTQISVRGADRSTFLHGMCTNDVKNLAAGQGREAFFTNVQGKTIGHAFLFAGDDAIALDATAGQAETLMPGLERYIIREDVQLVDRSGELGELLVAGPDAARLLATLTGGEVPRERLDQVAITIGGIPISLRRVDFVGGECFFVACDAGQAADVRAAIASGGAKPIGAEAVEAARIEQGTPLFGRDITPANLPQEVARDAAAISFNKGCYLGQETVARIDALGHVNRYLVGVRFDGDRPAEAGAKLTADDKIVGEVTSATFSPRLGAPLALAYVRRGHHEPGTKLQCDVVAAGIVAAEVVSLPVIA
ncbi:MAG: glycine cleavage T C-terminal barrel domain-containing protein [Pirellulales bacterium]